MKLFKVLANVWSTMRMPNDNLDDEDISEIVSYCQEWGKLLPVLFPERNITRKGHAVFIYQNTRKNVVHIIAITS